MLQQTTTQVVIPYFERFIEAFPTVQDLSQAPLEKVYTYWSGLGYYSRARNLHLAAKKLNLLKSFPKKASNLITYPGFGPYTSRSVSSLAFDEPVGVLDGNVIRVLTRVHDLDCEWWKTKERKFLQELADQWVSQFSSREMNQALMELGATICTPRSPSCALCPIKRSCLSLKNDHIALRPKSKPKKKKVIIHWVVQARLRKNQILLDANHPYPFLKSQPLPLGEMKVVKDKPKKFHFKHLITHYEIFVSIDSGQKRGKAEGGEWVPLKDLAQISPSSLVRKVVLALDSETR